MTNTNLLLTAGEVALRDRKLAGRTWCCASARGETSGLCISMQAALDRLVAWFSGEEISESPDGQASREEMRAAFAWYTSDAGRVRGNSAQVVEAALRADRFDTEEWLLGTAEVVDAIRRGMPAVAGAKITRGTRA